MSAGQDTLHSELPVSSDTLHSELPVSSDTPHSELPVSSDTPHSEPPVSSDTPPIKISANQGISSSESDCDNDGDEKEDAKCESCALLREEVAKLRSQLSFIRSVSVAMDFSCQAVPENIDIEISALLSSIPAGIDLNSGKSVAEQLSEAAEAAIGQTGYVYDERTGLYYDHVSGYYYDPVNLSICTFSLSMQLFVAYFRKTNYFTNLEQEFTTRTLKRLESTNSTPE